MNSSLPIYSGSPRLLFYLDKPMEVIDYFPAQLQQKSRITVDMSVDASLNHLSAYLSSFQVICAEDDRIPGLDSNFRPLDGIAALEIREVSLFSSTEPNSSAAPPLNWDLISRNLRHAIGSTSTFKLHISIHNSFTTTLTLDVQLRQLPNRLSHIGVMSIDVPVDEKCELRLQLLVTIEQEFGLEEFELGRAHLPCVPRKEKSLVQMKLSNFDSSEVKQFLWLEVLLALKNSPTSTTTLLKSPPRSHSPKKSLQSPHQSSVHSSPTLRILPIFVDLSGSQDSDKKSRENVVESLPHLPPATTEHFGVAAPPVVETSEPLSPLALNKVRTDPRYSNCQSTKNYRNSLLSPPFQSVKNYKNQFIHSVDFDDVFGESVVDFPCVFGFLILGIVDGTKRRWGDGGVVVESRFASYFAK